MDGCDRPGLCGLVWFQGGLSRLVGETILWVEFKRERHCYERKVRYVFVDDDGEVYGTILEKIMFLRLSIYLIYLLYIKCQLTGHDHPSLTVEHYKVHTI